MRSRLFVVVICAATGIALLGLLNLKNFGGHKKCKKKLADGCRRVYLDMGSNRGIQIRKLFEPYYYKDAPALPLYDQYFGKDRDDVCAFGFEPNPIHYPLLRKTERRYRSMGWRVHFIFGAASHTEGNVTFIRDSAGGSGHGEWGARIFEPGKPKAAIFSESDPVETVKAIDFPSWFDREIRDRIIPPGRGTPLILVKTDMEEHDNFVWSSMMIRGMFCDIDYMYGEHVDEMQCPLNYLKKFGKCKTTYIPLDDESHGMSDFPLPNGVSQ
jgi:hypothetical protein